MQGRSSVFLKDEDWPFRGPLQTGAFIVRLCGLSEIALLAIVVKFSVLFAYKS